MKTLLIFPPMVDAVHPPLGIATIAGYLKQIGNKDVENIDLNLAAHYYFFNSKYFAEIRTIMTEEYDSLSSKKKLNDDDQRKLEVLAEALSNAEYLINNIDEQVKLLKSPQLYNKLSAYYQVTDFMRLAQKYVSASIYPTSWSIEHQFEFRYSVFKSYEVLQAIVDKKENPFIDFYITKLPEILEKEAGLIGISICYFEQLIPAFTLIKQLKEAKKDLKIVIGGTYFTLYNKNWEVFNPFSKLVDLIIPDEGEKPFLNLINVLERSDDYSTIPGTVVFKSGHAEYIQLVDQESAFGSCLPDFSDFPLELYLAPYKILPYKTNLGCFWAKCTFCSSVLITDCKYKEKKADRILEDVKKLYALYDVKDFYFVDEALAPAVARCLAKEISRQKLPFHWFGDTRLEKMYTKDVLMDMHEGGCLMLSFGFESIVIRVLNKMKKNTNPDIIPEIIINCRQAGIKTFLMFFLGFPTETKEEAMETINFIEDHCKEIHYIAYDRFTLIKNTPVFNAPDEYGMIIEQECNTDEDLGVWFNYSCKTGLYGDELVKLVKATKERPIIRSLIKNVFSRSHLPYLPMSDLQE